MDNQLTFWQICLILLGFGYLANHRSKDIHRINEKHKNCHLEFISKRTGEYITRRKAMKLINKFGYNGCRWCWPGANKE